VNLQGASREVLWYSQTDNLRPAPKSNEKEGGKGKEEEGRSPWPALLTAPAHSYSEWARSPRGLSPSRKKGGGEKGKGGGKKKKKKMFTDLDVSLFTWRIFRSINGF